jgi:transcriptional regulator with XRE-family HTH domain
MSTDTAGAWRPTDTLGARLILLRRELGLSQRDAADRAGIPFGQWQGMEDDGRQPRGLDVKVARIAVAFGVDRDWLMWGGPLSGGSPNPTPGGSLSNPRYGGVRRAQRAALGLVKSHSRFAPLAPVLSPEPVAA